MYLSQLRLNLANRQVNRDLANPYELHRSLMNAFPVFDHEVERILFRVDGEHSEFILVQSTLKPDWSALMELSCYLLAPPAVKEFGVLPFLPEQVLRFRLRANPVKRVVGQKNRTALIKDEERLQWLLRKGDENGFFVQTENVLCHNAPWREFSMPDPKGGKKRATFNMVDYEGCLTVNDAGCLNEAIRNGIGPAKGIGCGLLSVARV